ncbi:hypothetical protein HFN01_19320 [Rhizobium leguminosarum]|uniref:hypothetical protein n=1 Tax=Rhizobium leguminosarum TaxID=384 RepID=UPI001C9449B9|nr:hypothetical protein [Rhizobium leguminosarum]MBY5396962.1 hypothetical protein [Rhizobium leguminosarum]
MPIARIPGGPQRSGVLFHHSVDSGETYKKEVNPKAFTNHFNAMIRASEIFASRYRTRRLMADGLLQDRAETQPMPDHVPIEEKSPRLVAIQLTKRFRDVQFRNRKGRRPPSVVIASEALDAGPMSDSLCDEVIAVATYMRKRIQAQDDRYRLLEVRNPAHYPDVFTDRWPEDQPAQRVWRDDLSRLVRSLTTLRAGDFDAQQLMKVLRELFGETLADRAVQDHYRAYGTLARHNMLGIGRTGAVKSVLAAPATLGLSTPARANTDMGGNIENPID